MKVSFQQFEFDFSDNSLRNRRGKRVSLRPKAALLLRQLLQQREQIIGKPALIESIWGHMEVDDQALFQLVAELRAKLEDPQLIQTYPGRGYQWNCVVRSAEHQPNHQFRWVLAGFLGALICVKAFDLLSFNHTSDLAITEHAPMTAFSPAADALAKAVEARSSGQAQQALGLLTIAIGEYPRFALAKLEMAETLRSTGDLIRAQGYAYDALSDARLAEDAYLEVAAHLLLSQLRWQQGDLDGALMLNSAAGQLAEKRQFVCAAELSSALDRMLIQALATPGEARHPPSLSQQSTLARCQETSLLQSEPGIPDFVTG